MNIKISTITYNKLCEYINIEDDFNALFLYLFDYLRKLEEKKYYQIYKGLIFACDTTMLDITSEENKEEVTLNIESNTYIKLMQLNIRGEKFNAMILRLLDNISQLQAETI